MRDNTSNLCQFQSIEICSKGQGVIIKNLICTFVCYSGLRSYVVCSEVYSRYGIDCRLDTYTKSFQIMHFGSLIIFLQQDIKH